ncbi:aspartate carbamoyltransferase regulatory subunit [Alkalibacter rhizosphaerae]|uniref:Aspartate carbamoyltransferase regulatory subunit n=1 Tax=Alkalibacter rhizosphaerae TaxID=2815577 RepID=A0A974XFG2_9FIRM|nr:aspartate carbamoyltransferase regulatory subunit [Alkalibacter rhizosphaerae]QSX07755.1 aspartate carbamoyltransferase regulatory subunit [Alkalibacter rhizosphaerae]
MINVSKIKKGIVIDHIAQGQGYKIFSQLKLDEIEDVVVLLRNIPSNKMGKKDLIKIETDIYLDLTVLGLIDPNITINIIKDGVRAEKIKLTLPEKVTGILKCKNPRCITQHEKVRDVQFHLADPEKRLYRCEYCDSHTSL